MPRVSDAYRRARRDEIALAAVRCLERKGVHETSIADIVEESGLSTGAIYSHFQNKAELARYIVSEYLFPRLDGLRDAGPVVRSPRDVIAAMLAAFTEDGLPAGIVVQFWGEAAAGGELRAEMLRTASRLRATLEAALQPWAQQRTTDAESATALSEERARAVIALAQGYIAHTAVFGPRDPIEYLESLAVALA
jgi:AcrR family transcriptional regulator